MTRRLGICFKCGKEALVQDHHWKGYSEEHKDDVKPYCCSCDQKAHREAKLKGKCTLDSIESKRLSSRSCNRRKKLSDPITYRRKHNIYNSRPKGVMRRIEYKKEVVTMLTFNQRFDGFRCIVNVHINKNSGHVRTNSYFYPMKRRS